MACSKIFCKVTDSSASPFIEQKDVILCRSGIQLYHKSEIQPFITEDNKPAIEKEWYREYRPASVVVKAQNLFKSLPVTKEHPNEWVTPKNFSILAGGTLDKEVSVVALDGEAEGEIGLKSNITFYTEELYNYYLNNKEVSVGYNCTKHFVDNPEEVGYDIILDEITEVNHLAITRAGRGGSKVAVIDSIIGGLKPMRTGIFAWLAGKKQKDSAPSSFGKGVLEAVKNSKGTTEEELASEMKGVMDSMSVLKDGEAKDKLMDIVKDCFDHKDMALENEAELVTTLDSRFETAMADSLSDVEDKKTEDSEESVEDSADKKTEEKTEDSEEKTEEKEEKTEDSEEKEEKSEDSEEGKKDKEEDGCNKDSVAFVTKADLQAVTDSLGELITEKVKECLGLKDSGKTPVKGSEIDSITKDESYDYDSFLGD